MADYRVTFIETIKVVADSEEEAKAVAEEYIGLVLPESESVEVERV